MAVSFDIAESAPIREALIRFNIAYRIRERPNVVIRPTNAVNPRKAKALAARNMRAEATTTAAVVVVVQPGSEVTLYDLNPPAQANGYTWLFVELGTPVQYAGYVVEALGDAKSFEVLPVEPPPEAVYSVWLTDDEIRQSAQLHTIVAQAETERMAASKKIADAHLALAAILNNALQRAQPTVLDTVSN